MSPRSATVRWQSVGPLTVETHISGVFQTDATDALSAPRHRSRCWRSRSVCRLVTMTARGPAVTEAPPCHDDGPPWRLESGGYDEDPVIATLRLDSGATATLPIDRARMRYRTPTLDIDGAWLAHHYAWVRGPDGADRLAARADFEALPHRGALSPPKPGDYQAYDLGPGGPRLQAAVVKILVMELHGVRMAEEYSVQYLEGSAVVSVHSYKSRSDVMARIASHLDGVLASGRLDAVLVEDAR